MELSILGLSFEIAAPYSEGNVINAAEAKTLNQTRKENISNALRKQIDGLKSTSTAEDGTEVSAFTDEAKAKAAELVAAYDSTYTFSLGASGTARTPVDPVEKEAFAIARLKVNEAIQKKGGKVKDYDKDAYNAKVAEVAAMEKVVAEAKRRVASRGKMDLDVAV